MSEPNEPIVWQPTEPASLQPAVDSTAPASDSTSLTSVVPVSAEAPAFHGRLDRGNILKGAIGLVAGIAIVASVAIVAGTAPTSDGNTAGAAPQTSSSPKASGRPQPFRVPSIGGIFGFGGGLPGAAVSPFGGVTIASINGTTVGLKTADGWTRTVTVDGSVKVTEAGRTMSAGDLKVGQAVRLQEKRSSDGTFTVTGLVIVTPSVVGQVTAKTATTITIKRFDGTTQTIDVDSSTTYRVQGASTSDLAAITVGMTIVASGPQASDGTIHAFTVQGGNFRVDRPFNGNHPGASGAPKPSAAPQGSGTNG